MTIIIIDHSRFGNEGTEGGAGVIVRLASVLIFLESSSAAPLSGRKLAFKKWKMHWGYFSSCPRNILEKV